MSNVSIVTGGCGFIGSHIVDELVNRDHEVIVIDDLSAECNEEFFRNSNATYLEESILNYDAIEASFQGASTVFHLAAESRIQPTLERPQDACKVNFVGTCNVLQAAKEHNVKKVIYSSTSAGYGLKNSPPLTENMRRDCLNPYSVSKVAAEDLCKMYYTLWGLPTIILRYFNIYGERQPLKGQYAPVIGIFLRQKEAKEALTIVGDGLQKRDFTHVSDALQANIKAMETEDSSCYGEIFNVGTGANTSVFDIAKLISNHYTFIPAREGEAQTTLADITKIKSKLGYSPQVQLKEWIAGYGGT
jgi:UDP-glucose 4-epimerase